MNPTTMVSPAGTARRIRRHAAWLLLPALIGIIAVAAGAYALMRDGDSPPSSSVTAGAIPSFIPERLDGPQTVYYIVSSPQERDALLEATNELQAEFSQTGATPPIPNVNILVVQTPADEERMWSLIGDLNPSVQVIDTRQPLDSVYQLEDAPPAVNGDQEPAADGGGAPSVDQAAVPVTSACSGDGLTESQVEQYLALGYCN